MAEDETPQPQQRDRSGPTTATTGIGLIALLSALVMLGQASTSLYVPSLPSLGAALGADPTRVKLTMTAYLLAFAVGQLVYGPLSDRFGRRPVLLAGIAIFSTATLACAAAPSIDALIAARALQGFGAAAGVSISRAVVRDRFERDAAVRVLAYIGMALSISPALGPILGGQLQVWGGWRAAFGAQFALGLVIALWVASALAESLRTPDPAATQPARLLRNYRMLAGHRVFVVSTVLNGAIFAGLFGYVTAVPFVFIDIFAVRPDIFSTIFIFTVAGYFIGTAIATRLVRLGGDRLIGIGVLVALAGGALMLLPVLIGFTHPVQIVFAMLVFLIGFGLVVPNAIANAMAPFPRVAGTASALFGFAQTSVAALGSIAVATTYDGTVRPMAATVFAAGLVAVVAHWGFGRNAGARP